MMIQSTDRQIELEKQLDKEKNPKKREQLIEAIKEEIRNNPVRKACEGFFDC